MSPDKTQASKQEQIMFTRRYRDVQRELRRTAREVRDKHVNMYARGLATRYLRNGDEVGFFAAYDILESRTGILVVILVLIVFVAAPLLFLWYALSIVAAGSGRI